MSRTYKVELMDSHGNSVFKEHIAEDVHIRQDSIKFLNGKGAGATVVAYYPAHRVQSLEESK